ncbi:MAG: GNAT family N-acetyltransferase [Candidatus Zixiibacteriota bacterium]
MISIRELRPDDDLNQVLTLCKDFFAEYEQHHEEFFDTDNLSDDDISGRFIQSMESDDSATIIALMDNKIVGYASVVVRDQPRFYKIKKVGAISAIMVAKDFRRQGIATKILTESKNFFGKCGVKYFTFYTSVANKEALKLYEKCGFEPLHYSFLGKT